MGKYTFNYTIDTEAHIDGFTGERPYFKAYALDEKGNQYRIIWDVVDGWETIEDESDMCDWDHPTKIERI